MGVQQAKMSSDLRPARTEEGQANEPGWESPACSCVATYFAEWHVEGEIRVLHTHERVI